MSKVAEVSAKDLGIDIEGLSQEDLEATVNIFRPAMFNSKDNVVSVLVDGKREYFQVTPDIYKALTGMETEDAGLLIKILSYPAKWLRAGAVLSPDFFMLKNPGRDTMSAFVYSKYGFIPVWDNVRGLFELLKKGKDYDLWRASGGERSMLVSVDRVMIQKTFKQAVEDRGFTDYIKHPLEMLQILSEFTESATRMGEFKRALAAGAGPLRSSFASRDLTLDFAIMGARTRSYNMIKAFFNANMRAQEKLIREARQNPKSFFPKVLIGITLPSIILYLINRDEDWWKETPQWQKDLFWLFKVGDTIIRLPKPFELGIIFGSVPERILEYLDNQDSASMSELAKSVIGGFGIGPDIFIPTGAVPIIENMTNWDFFLERNIIPASEQNDLPELQYSDYTPETFKLLGDWLGFSPRMIENLFTGYTAGLGGYAIQAMEGILKGTGIVSNVEEPTGTWADVPILKALVVRDPYGSGSKSVNDLYNIIEDLTQGEQALKKWLEEGNIAKYEDYIKAHPETMFFYDYENGSFYSASARYLRTVTKTLSELRSDQNKIYSSEDLTPDEKKTKIDEINKLMTETAALALAHLKVMPDEFSEIEPVQPDRSNYYNFLSELPKSLRDSVWINSPDMDEATAGVSLAYWNDNHDNWSSAVDLYYLDTAEYTSGQKTSYRSQHWEIDVALNLLGRVTTVRSAKARAELIKAAKALGIPLEDIPALN